MKTNRLSSAIARALQTSLVVGMAMPALAQDQDEASAELDRLTVTGSRIKRADIESASPVFVIQREAIERSGLTSVGDLLQDLPIAGAALNTQFNNGGNGETRLDLRNLGSARLLVLLNGRRFTSNLGGTVDLNNFPVAIIKRIEILKDGASSIYGSDAIAGVVNIITRDDFEGLQANAYFGQNESENDGEIQAYDFSVGSTSDRGSVFFNASYVQAEAVFSGDRRISAEPQFGTQNSFGSSGTPQGRFGAAALGTFALTTDPGTNVTGPGGLGAAAFRPADFSFGAPGSGGDRFNFAPDNYLLTPQERTNVFTQGTYDVTDDMRLSVEASFNNRKSDQLLAPTPLFLGCCGFGSNLAANVPIDAGNSFNPFGITLNPSSYILGRRLVEAGPRILNQDVDSFRFALGLEGSFELGERYWDWDVNYGYGEIDRTDRNFGRVNVQRVLQALSGQPCRDDVFSDGCVELNLFGGQGADGNGTITPEMLNYILYTENQAFGNTLRNYTGNITTELLDMPAGPLGVALGYEHREEEGFDSPDALVSAGITSGTARGPTSGSFSVDEFYVEFAVPLLSGVTGAERLDLSLSSRWSDYDVFGDTVNSKIGLEWQPIDDLLLRATFSEGFRAPSINELFGGASDSFPLLTDPCNGLDTDGDGVGDTTPNLAGCAGVPGSYQQSNSQIRITVGSNPNLTPESSESVTFGFVYSPSWLDGMDLTIDYYNIELDNTLTRVGASAILNNCANTGTVLCDRVTRGPSGAVLDLLNSTTNIGGSEVEGVDFLVSYSFPETDYGFFRVVWDGAYQGTNKNTVLASNGSNQLVRQNLLGRNIGDGAFTRWKSNVDVNWSYGDWEATWGVQFVLGSEEVCESTPTVNGPISGTFGFCNSGPDSDNSGFQDNRHIGSATYHDVQLSYHLSEYDTRLTFGVNNLFDKGPPISVTAFANSFNVADYRVPGVFPYVRATIDF